MTCLFLLQEDFDAADERLHSLLAAYNNIVSFYLLLRYETSPSLLLFGLVTHNGCEEDYEKCCMLRVKAVLNVKIGILRVSG